MYFAGISFFAGEQKTLSPYRKRKYRFRPHEEKNYGGCMINNCQFRSWIEAEFTNGILSISGSSDSAITRGILSLFKELLSGLQPTEVLKSDSNLFSEIGLDLLQISSRFNVIQHVIKKVHQLAEDELSSPLKEGRHLSTSL